MNDAPPSEFQSRLKSWGALGLIAVAGLGLLWVTTASCRPETPKTGQQAGALQLKTEDGATHTLDRYRGKVVLVDVWATWCPPCRASLPEIVALQKAADDRYAVVAISVDKGGFDDIRPFFGQHPELKLESVVPVDPRSLQILGDVRGIPASFILDRQGKVVASWVGFHPGRAEAELKQYL